MRRAIRQAHTVNRLINTAPAQNSQKRLLQNVVSGNTKRSITSQPLFLIGVGAVMMGAGYKITEALNNKDEQSQQQQSIQQQQQPSSNYVVTSVPLDEEPTITAEQPTHYINEEEATATSNTALFDQQTESVATDAATTHEQDDSSRSVAAIELQQKLQQDEQSLLEDQLRKFVEQQTIYQNQIANLNQQLEEEAKKGHDQLESVKSQLESELRSVEAKASTLQSQVDQLQTLLRENEERLASLKQEYEQKLQAQIDEHEAQVAAKLAEANQIAEEKKRRAIEDKEHELYLAFNEDKLSRAEVLRDLSNKVYGLEYVYQTNIRYLQDSFSLQQYTSGVLALQHILRTNAPFKPEVDVLRKLAKEDELVHSILDSIPQELVVNGVPKVDDLADRFKVVKKKAIRAAYSPSNTLFGYLYARVATLFVMEERGFVEGNTVDASLARAEFYLENRKLSEAIAELENIYRRNYDQRTEEGLYGLNSEQVSDVEFVLRDWVNSAKSRLLADQALEILEAHLLVLTNAINK